MRRIKSTELPLFLLLAVCSGRIDDRSGDRDRTDEPARDDDGDRGVNGGEDGPRTDEPAPEEVFSSCSEQPIPARLWKAVSILKTTNQKRLGACTSGPLFIFTSRFDLFAPYLLTLLLIGGRFVLQKVHLRIKLLLR